VLLTPDRSIAKLAAQRFHALERRGVRQVVKMFWTEWS